MSSEKTRMRNPPWVSRFLVVYTKITHSMFVRRIALLVVVAAALGFGGSGAVASSASRVGVIKLDSSKTLVEFRLGGSIHDTHGKFQLKDGSIRADPSTGKAEGTIIVDAASGDSGDSMRDNRMKDNVLEAAQYPEIIFSARHIDGHVEKGGGFRARLEGVLKLHGSEHQIVMETSGTLIGGNLVATAHFSIPYVEWGLKDPSVLFLTVAKQVDIDIATAGIVTWLASEKVSSHRP